MNPSRQSLSVLVLAAAVLTSGCGQVEAPEDGWYRHLGKGRMISLPFSRDLEVMGLRGWQFLGKMPRAAKGADVIRYSIWHEVWEGEIEPEQIVSGQPPPGTYHGAWNVEDAESLRIDLDILLDRSAAGGRPIYSQRIIINGQEHRRPLELPDAYRYEVELEDSPGRLKIQESQPILLSTGRFRSWTQGGDGTRRQRLKERVFRWYLLVESTHGDGMP